MTTLYRLVQITSAEQAEALPVGTLAISSEMYDSGDSMHWAAVKVGLEWARTDAGDGLPVFSDAGMVDVDVPWTALVPIETEEERARSQINITHLSPPAPQMVPVRLPCPRCGLR